MSQVVFRVRLLEFILLSCNFRAFAFRMDEAADKNLKFSSNKMGEDEAGKMGTHFRTFDPFGSAFLGFKSNSS